MSEPVDFAIEQAKLRGTVMAEWVADRCDANGLERDIIHRLEQLVRHGCKDMDLTVRKDGRDYHFQVDWLARLFRVQTS